VKISEVKTVLYTGFSVNSIDTVHISTNVVEIQYKIPAENAFEYL
jgi:hypothetical protein